MKAKDLTKECPRSPLEEVGGFAWLPRLIDKVRAKCAGTLGEYTAFPCGADKRFLTAYGIDADSLEKFILSGATDQEIADWSQQHAFHEPQEVGAAYRAGFLTPAAPEIQERLEQAKAQLAAQRPGLDLGWVDNFTKLILAEEGHPMPAAAR